MMDELREMARAPVDVFDRFLGELQRITGDKTLTAPTGLERVKDLQAAMVREIEESLQRFRAKVGESEGALAAILRPPRPKLFEEIQRATQHLAHLIELAARREKLIRAWEDQPADVTVAAYRAALDQRDLEAAEFYEAEAERVLRRKGNPTALQRFLELRAQAEEHRQTPAQKQARADLEEIERLKHEVTLGTRVVTSTLKVSGSIAAVGAGWRKGGRLRLEAGDQRRTSVLILPGPHPGMTASVVDVSRSGMRLAISSDLSPGTLLNLVLRHANGRDGELRMQGEVRWCRADVRTPGRFLAGVRLVSTAGDQWAGLLSRLAEIQQDGRIAIEHRDPERSGGSRSA